MQIDHQTLDNVTTTPLTLSAGGQEVWAFEAIARGETIISLEYSQPWEGGKKRTWIFELIVMAR
jgi:predicted secreted protein